MTHLSRGKTSSTSSVQRQSRYLVKFGSQSENWKTNNGEVAIRHGCWSAMIFEFSALYSLRRRFNFTPNTSGILKKRKGWRPSEAIWMNCSLPQVTVPFCSDLTYENAAVSFATKREGTGNHGRWYPSLLSHDDHEEVDNSSYNNDHVAIIFFLIKFEKNNSQTCYLTTNWLR